MALFVPLYLIVHLRIRNVDQMVPKSLYPSSSGTTYWQVEAESSILQGRLGAGDR